MCMVVCVCGLCLTLLRFRCRCPFQRPIFLFPKKRIPTCFSPVNLSVLSIAVVCLEIRRCCCVWERQMPIYLIPCIHTYVPTHKDIRSLLGVELGFGVGNGVAFRPGRHSHSHSFVSFSFFLFLFLHQCMHVVKQKEGIYTGLFLCT